MWLLIGLIFGAGFLALVLALRSRKIVVRWNEWLIGVLGLLLAFWAFHDFFASIAEHNNTAALTFLWMLGTPAIILIGLSVFLPWWRQSRKTKR